MERPWIRWFLLAAALSVVPTACGSSSSQTHPASAASTSGPNTMWLAVLSFAADPNALDDDRAAVLDALGQSVAVHVVVSPGACYTGLPARFGADYVLAIWDADEDVVRADADDAGRELAWIGVVTGTCVD